MPIRLRILAASRARAEEGEGPAADRVVELPDDAAEIRIGRRADLEVPLPFAAVSELHARLVPAAGGAVPSASPPALWMLEDLGGAGGTWLGAERLSPGAPRPLSAGAELAVGAIALLFEGPQPAAAAAEGTATIARRLLQDLFAAAPDGGAPELEVLGGPEAGRRLPLRERERPYLVGRGPACDLALADEALSREHAAFVWTAAGVQVRDLGSKNGVLVAGERANGARPLHDQQIAELGPVKLRLHDPAGRYLQELTGPSPPPQPPPEPEPEPEPEPAVRPPPRSRAAPLAVAFAAAVLAGVAAAVVALLAS